jgi:YidC/Oxa1 family membrane protein insertase
MSAVSLLLKRPGSSVSSSVLYSLKLRSHGPAASSISLRLDPSKRGDIPSLSRFWLTKSPSSGWRHFSTSTGLYNNTSSAANVHTPDSSTLQAPSVSTEPLLSSDSVDLSSFESSAPAKWASDAAVDVLTELPPQGDLASLGLCANTPVGWLQYMIEYIHIHASLPWWGAIVASTFLLRIVIFPVVMKIQKNGVLMNNINPEIHKLMKRQREYKQMGNKALADQYSHKIWSVYQKHNCNPLKMAVMPLIQLPLFLSFFIAIRRMAAVPVESMKTGGVFWFTDLTVPDPYYVLPVLACGCFVASIELGGETGVGNPQTARLKNVFRLMPIILIPITASFPTGLFMYWLPASFISISQILLLKMKKVRSFFGIPQMIQHPPEAQEQSKGFMGYFKES